MIVSLVGTFFAVPVIDFRYVWKSVVCVHGYSLFYADVLFYPIFRALLM